MGAWCKILNSVPKCDIAYKEAYKISNDELAWLTEKVRHIHEILADIYFQLLQSLLLSFLNCAGVIFFQDPGNDPCNNSHAQYFLTHKHKT